MTPSVEAKLVVEKYGTRDPFALAELMGVTVIPCIDFGTSIRGVAIQNCGWYYVGLNTRLSYPQKRIVLAHELGHITCHSHINYFFMTTSTLFSVSRFECEANEFAAEILIPDNAFTISNDIRIIAAELNIPVELFQYKKLPNDGFCSI